MNAGGHPGADPATDDRRRWGRVAGLVLALLLVAGACSDDDDSSGDDGSDAPDEEAEEVDDGFVDGPAPANWDDDVAFRVDEVGLDGDTLDLVVTVVTREERRLYDDDIRLVTNTGIELPRADEQERTIPAGSVATLEIRSEGLTEPVRSVELTLLGMDVTVEVPADGERNRWAPAPERQVGFADALMRDRSEVVVVPYTFRTEGLVSELTFLGVNTDSNDPTLCHLECRLEDGDGNVYPWLGSRYVFAEARGSRVRGTLRFLGQVPPDVTDLRLFIEGASGNVVVVGPDLEFGFQLPRAEDSELSVSASNTRPEPFDVDIVMDNGQGLQVELGEMTFFDDRIQLDIVATASADRGWDLNDRGRSLLRDPSGYEHPLARPAGGGELTVPAGGTVEASLVFLAPLDVSADELHVVFEVDYEVTFEHTIPLPDRPDATEEDE